MGTAKGLSASSLKWIAIAAMLVDHIAWGFVPLDSAAGQLMHTVGRLTAPTMCYLIAEGYFYTRSIRRYALRLLAFALISHIPFVLFQTGRWFGVLPLNMLFTLLLGLLALAAWDRVKNRWLAVLVIALCCIGTVAADWPLFGMLYILAFGMRRGDFRKQAFWFAAVSAVMALFPIVMDVANGRVWYRSLFHFGVFLTLPLLARYNGRRGGFRGGKWIFYIFYPAHLLALGLLRIL